MSKSQGFQFNWLASAGSALGAVSSAALLSTLGAAGTIFGAALGSLIITVGGSFYTQSLEKTKNRVAAVRTREDRTASRQNVGSTVVATPRASEGAVPGDGAPMEDRDQASRTSLPWKRIIGIAIGVFVAAMAIILIFELFTGRPVSSYTGGSDAETGTTFSRLGSGSTDSTEPGAEDSEVPPADEEQSTKDEPAEEEPAEEEPVEEEPAEAPPAEAPPAEAPPAEAPPAQSDE